MFAYYLDLARRSLKRTPVLTALMVLAIGLGIGASMTMITVLHVMSGDPAPGLSSQLYVPMLDPRDASNAAAKGSGTRSTPDGFTWIDAMNLLREHRADRQAAMDAGSVAIRPARADMHPFFEAGAYVTSDFFRMFGAPFSAGTGWSAGQDQDRARVVVLNAALDRKLFGNTGGVGKTVQLNNVDFTVAGVLHDWHPQPKFYAQHGGRIFGQADQFFLPLATAMDLKFQFNDHLNGWGNSVDSRKSDTCTWLQYWVQLDSPAKAAAYRTYLDNYWRDQQAHGRFPRKDAPPQLFGLMA